jgi:hypothetical protein
LPPLLIVVGPAVNVSDGAYGEVAAAATPLSTAEREISAAIASIDLNANRTLDRWP